MGDGRKKMWGSELGLGSREMVSMFWAKGGRREFSTVIALITKKRNWLEVVKGGGLCSQILNLLSKNCLKTT